MTLKKIHSNPLHWKSSYWIFILISTRVSFWSLENKLFYKEAAEIFCEKYWKKLFPFTVFLLSISCRFVTSSNFSPQELDNLQAGTRCTFPVIELLESSFRQDWSQDINCYMGKGPQRFEKYCISNDIVLLNLRFLCLVLAPPRCYLCHILLKLHFTLLQYVSPSDIQINLNLQDDL